MMKKILTCLLATLGLSTACGQQNFENTDVKGFAELIDKPTTLLLDVRSAEEFASGHLEGAINIDQSQSDFVEKAKATLPADKTIAIYCRSGRRSANAANRLAAEGYRCVNLKGGILAWQEAKQPVTTSNYEMDMFTTKRTVDLATMPKADYILVTHEHGDHFDKAAISLLQKEGTQVITNQRCADMLGSGRVMANGDALTLADDVKIEAVPAYNTTEGREQFHPKGRDNGYILTVDGLRIYIAGDTEDIPEMTGISDIDIAFLPCNQPYTMTPEQLLKAARTVKPKVLFPYHYGQTDVSGIPSQLQPDGIDVRIRHYE